MNRIDLDNQATTRLDPLVFEAMRPWLLGRGGNASSTQHASGRDARDAVESAREEVAAAIGCQPRELIFTSGATEANNLAIRGVLEASREHSQFITTAAEHRSVLDPGRRLSRMGYVTTVLPVDEEGRVDPAAIAQAAAPTAMLVSVMLANNEVGTINDLTEICRVAERQRLLVHCDAAQGLGEGMAVLSRAPVDLLSLSAHKIHGPQGVGALLVRRGSRRIPIRPLLEGGGHELGLRSGTLPTALIVGFGEAVRILRTDATRTHDLCSRRNRLWELLRNIPGIRRNGPPLESGLRLSNNLNVSFEGIDGAALLARIDQAGLDVSSGAACSSSDPEPSHVLRAIGLNDALARASLRFGLSRFTTDDEIDRAAAIVSDAVTSLRGETTQPPGET
ncbi:MAG: cysteine desulfurase [Planctomyces sp.]|nr:cysteine desulfurase [Planctomyces sp.]